METQETPVACFQFHPLGCGLISRHGNQEPARTWELPAIVPRPGFLDHESRFLVLKILMSAYATRKVPLDTSEGIGIIPLWNLSMTTRRSKAITRSMDWTLIGQKPFGAIPSEWSLWLDFLTSCGSALWHSSTTGFGQPFSPGARNGRASYP